MPAPDYATEIAALEAGMASGEASIEGPDGRRVAYRSIKEIRDGLAYFRAQAAQSAGTATSSVTVASFSRF